jgi:hypothetical protein
MMQLIIEKSSFAVPQFKDFPYLRFWFSVFKFIMVG